MGSLYEQDFIAWTEQQASVLRGAARGGNLPLDWEHLAEEVEDLGRSHYVAVASQVARIVEHLLKLEFSPAADPRRGWRNTVRDARAAVERRLRSDPGLTPRLVDMIADEAPRAARLAAAAMSDFGEDPAGIVARLRTGTIYPPEQILGDWFPDGGV